MPRIAELTSLWRRTLIAWPDGRRDTTTAVRWLQGPQLYVDLRQPADRPSFARVHGLRDLTREQLEWLARQEGFAGELTCDGRYFEWRRDIDFQPPAPLPDSGSLRFEGELMIEEGRDLPYIEHWRREVQPMDPVGALRLRERESERTAILVRVGTRFMYARARQAPLPQGGRLLERVHAAASIGAAQDFVDCEISFGSIGAGVWRIEHSSLPFREGAMMTPLWIGSEPMRVRIEAVAADGGSLLGDWDVERAEGAPL